MRLALVVALVAILAITALSFTVFGETNAGAITSEDGVLKVENAEQLISLFENPSTLPASGTIRLMNDIDVDGKLVTLQKKFIGVIEGNGKTISGLTAPIFKQFCGTVSDLTLRGTINAADASDRAASFALNVADATFTNLVSYVDITVKGANLYAGGLVGYAEGKNSFVGCEYHGEIKAEWTENAAAVGGIVGYVNPNGKKNVFEDDFFGGKLTVSGGVANKNIAVGGILGQCAQGAVSLTNCASVGAITSTVTTGVDYAGGILGINDSVQTSVEYCANKSNITAVKNAGGIFGGITVASKVMNCTNFGEIVAAMAGEFCGNGKGVNLSCFSSYDFSKANNKLCGTDFTSNSCYASDAVTLEKTFTLGTIEYETYNVCTVEKATGLLIQPLKTHKMFEAFVSIREDGDKQALRFVVLTNMTCTSTSVTVSVKFKDYGENVIKSYTGKLGGADSDLTAYAAVTAGGENYFATEGCAIFGCVITDVPIGAWNEAELTIVDTASGAVYLEPVKLDGYKEHLTMDSLPDLSVMGTVSGVYNCGPGLASDKEGVTEEDSYMTVVSSTTKEKFEAYVKALPDAGFSFISKTTLDGDDYYTYSRYGALLYLYYNERVAEARVITDNSSDSLAKINYDYTPKAGEQAQFYQYSINYSGHDKEGYDPVIYSEGGLMDCGMFYMMKTSDNKIIMIDGGHSGQLSANAKKYLMNYMHEITGTPANEKITIAAWYITHAHGDHVAVARDFLNSYYNQINLESVIYNFPLYGVVDGYDDNTFGLKDAIRNHFPNTLYHKLHTGEVVNFGDIRMEVVYTHEDAVSNKGKTELSEFNSSSTVLKVVIDNKSIMMLGDVYHMGANTMLKMHSKDYLKSDVLQVAHHGYNDMANLYKVIGAQIALFPNAMTAKDGSTYKTVMAFAKEAYFAHKWTYRLTVENGAIKITEVKRYDQK